MSRAMIAAALARAATAARPSLSPCRLIPRTSIIPSAAPSAASKSKTVLLSPRYLSSTTTTRSTTTTSYPARPNSETRAQWRENLSSALQQDRTPLYDLHIARGGKMVLFGGHHMPVQYADQTLTESHHFTREHASLFDVSHMVQHRFTGRLAASFLEKVTPSSVSSMDVGTSKLSTFLWPGTGGIVDDTMITRTGEEEFRVVSNAGTREKVFKYLEEQVGDLQQVSGTEAEGFWWEVLRGLGLLAVQGPESAGILGEVIDPAEGVDLGKVYFGQNVFARLRVRSGEDGASGEWITLPGKAMISRGGYTGEDGFEVSFESPGKEAEMLTKTMLAVAGTDRLRLAGLGARDSLRLEAGMCLYGHDIDDSTTPVEAGLAWIVPKERRHEGAGFHGAEVISGQIVIKSKGGKGVDRRRVGLVVQGAPAREGAEIVMPEDGEKIGVVTSGSPSPTLGKNIAMGYVKDGMHKAGTEVEVVVRGRRRGATVTKMPFVESKYYKG